MKSGTPIHRIHRDGLDPWWFSSDGQGRFDLDPPDGTCYLAQRSVGGLLEVFKGMTVVSEDDVEARREFETSLPDELVLANCCVAGAARFGVNAEIHTTADYGKTHAWATTFKQAGFNGIRYFLRSDPALKLIGYAVFGPAGGPPAGTWPHGPSTEISAGMLKEAAKYGLTVVPTP